MTVTLSLEMEARVRKVAQMRGRDADAAGRSISLEDYEQQLQERRRTRKTDGAKDTL